MNRALAEAIVRELSVSKSALPDASAWQSFDERAWDTTLMWLDLSGLALYLRRRLETSDCLGTIPVRVRRRLDSCQTENQMRAAAMADELKALTDMFTAAGIEHLVLKGITLVPDYCPNPALRTQYDHDLLIRADSAERTGSVLRTAGYCRKNLPSEHPFVYHRPEPDIRFPADFMGFYSPRLGRSIELHLNLWGRSEDRIEINLPEDLFDRALPRRWQDFEFMALSDEDALVFQILHAFRHVLRNWCRLSVFLEIAVFLNQQDSDRLFWKRFAARIGNLDWVLEATVVVFGLAELLFDAPVPVEIKREFSSQACAPLTLWIERYGRKSAIANFRGDKYSLFLHREFVQDPVAWAGIRRQRLFPAHRPHRPSAVVFQRGFSRWGKLSMEAFHALRRLKFHAVSALGYVWEYRQWTQYRRAHVSLCAKAKRVADVVLTARAGLERN